MPRQRVHTIIGLLALLAALPTLAADIDVVSGIVAKVDFDAKTFEIRNNRSITNAVLILSVNRSTVGLEHVEVGNKVSVSYKKSTNLATKISLSAKAAAATPSKPRYSRKRADQEEADDAKEAKTNKSASAAEESLAGESTDEVKPRLDLSQLENLRRDLERLNRERRTREENESADVAGKSPPKGNEPVGSSQPPQSQPPMSQPPMSQPPTSRPPFPTQPPGSGLRASDLLEQMRRDREARRQQDEARRQQEDARRQQAARDSQQNLDQQRMAMNNSMPGMQTPSPMTPSMPQMPGMQMPTPGMPNMPGMPNTPGVPGMRMIKECSNCKKEVPQHITAGGKCPHCGVFFEEDKTNGKRATNPASVIGGIVGLLVVVASIVAKVMRD